jgi:capsular polysaccharide biosynthesis protein
MQELWRLRHLLLSAFIVSTGIGLLFLWLEPPRYESNAILYVHQLMGNEPLIEGEVTQPSAEVTLVHHVLTSRPVIDQVVKDLGLARAMKADTATALGKARLRQRIIKMIEVRSIDRSTIQVIVRAPDRWRAVAINNAVCKAAIGLVKGRLRAGIARVTRVREQVLKEVNAELVKSRTHSLALLDTMRHRSLTPENRVRLETRLGDLLALNSQHQQELLDLLRVHRASVASLRKEAIEPITVLVKAEPDVRSSLWFAATLRVLFITLSVFVLFLIVLVLYIKRRNELYHDWLSFNTIAPAGTTTDRDFESMVEELTMPPPTLKTEPSNTG